jgi:DNA polymerase-3 subunit alpha
MENAVEYAEHKKADSETGQASLFGDAGVAEYEDFMFEHVEDWPSMEKLTNEQELIGCYVSGHPLDSYRKVIANSASMTTDRMKYAQMGREWDAAAKKYRGTQYTMVGMVKNLEQKISKKTGKQFATAEFEDLTGTVALIFWADAWEKIGDAVKSAIEAGAPVLALQGSVQEDTFSATATNGAPSDEDAEEAAEADTKYQFVVEDLLDINNLAAKSIQEIHITLEPFFTEETQLDPIRDLLSDVSGNCMVYFHLETMQGPITIKAHTSLRVPSSEDFIEKLVGSPLVESAWAE